MTIPKDFELAIEWLVDAGVIYRIPRVRKAGIPLKYYGDFSSFKLFLVDHGLMGAMVDAPIADILLKKNVFEEYRGTFTEQYVLEQLLCALGGGICYFDSDTSKLELDFLIQHEADCELRPISDLAAGLPQDQAAAASSYLVPIEVKAEENLRSKSLRQFHLDHPGSRPVRLSMSDYRRQDWMTNLPLYAACRIGEM